MEEESSMETWPTDFTVQSGGGSVFLVGKEFAQGELATEYLELDPGAI